MSATTVIHNNVFKGKKFVGKLSRFFFYHEAEKLTAACSLEAEIEQNTGLMVEGTTIDVQNTPFFHNTTTASHSTHEGNVNMNSLSYQVLEK